MWNDCLVFILLDHWCFWKTSREFCLFIHHLVSAEEDEWIVLGAEIGWLGKLRQKGGDNFILGEKADAEVDSSRGECRSLG